MGERWIGRRLVRREDRRFLTGTACYSDDLASSNAARAVVVRSPHPHARITRIDTSSATSTDGVLVVLTGADIHGVLGPIPTLARTAPFARSNRDGSPMPDSAQPALALGRVRYVGEPVAMVIAENEVIARDAADSIEVDYEPLPKVISYSEVRSPPVPIWDEVPGNVTLDWEHGDRAATDAAFADAEHVVEVALENNRVAPVFLEPRAAIAEYDEAADRYTLTLGCQTAHGMRALLSSMLGIDPSRLHVKVPDMGGGFGARGTAYPEFALVLLAAKRTGRCVAWTAGRGESFLSDAQSRDHLLHGALALGADGHFLAIRAFIEWRHGAYIAPRSFHTMIAYLAPTIGGAYRIPTGYVEMKGYFSNTTPQAAYRGIGRVESNYLTETLVDLAAAATGLDRSEIRRRNLLGSADMPWTAPGGGVYHGGDFAANLAHASARIDLEGFETRREGAEQRGRLRGIAVVPYVENDGGAPADFARVEANTDGTVTVFAGTQNFGMGHETFYAQITADRLGIHVDVVRFVCGDTERVAEGFGSHGSRSARIGGTACVMGIERLIERGRALAGEMLEAATEDIGYANGQFSVSGTDRSVALVEAASFAGERGEALDGEARFETVRESLGNGAHACEVEIDPETGALDIVRYVIVADTGCTINPMIVEGQLHGGAAQGLGQAVHERVVYDETTGQTLSGSFMDYAVPRANDLPSLEVVLTEIEETDNPLGIKGVGEGGTTGAPAALMGAVRDALSPLGVTAIDMPVTPERLWRAIRAASTGILGRSRG